MYRSRKGKGDKSDKGSAPPNTSDAIPRAEAGGSAHVPTGDTNTTSARAIIAFKGAFTTPSMVFNPSTRRIEVNPHHDRAAVTELARAQAALLRGLRDLQHDAARHTPKELLYGLERAVLLLLASTAVAHEEAPLVACGDDAGADARLPTLEGFFAHHSAPAKAVAATAYALAEGLSHRALLTYVDTLQARLQGESEPALERLRSAEETAALAATRGNVMDFAQVLSHVQVAYGAIPRASTSAQPDLLRGSAAGGAASVSDGTLLTSANLLVEAYYRLLRWVLAIDPDRRALAQGGGTTHGTAAAAATGSAKVTEYEPYEGKIALSRTSPTTPWGCVFNGRGYLVSISNELRHSSEAGERLFQALQQKSGPVLGIPVLEANRRRLRPAELSEEELHAQRGNITSGLRDSLTSEACVLHLTVPGEAQETLTAPQEVVFELMQQGGEGVGGQRVLLVLRRASPSIPWGVRMVKDTAGTLRLTDFSDRIHLSPRARDFLFDHRGSLAIVGLNHKSLSEDPAAATGPQLREMLSHSLVMALWIRVDRRQGAVVEAKTVDVSGEGRTLGGGGDGQPGGPDSILARDTDGAAVELAGAEDAAAELHSPEPMRKDVPEPARAAKDGVIDTEEASTIPPGRKEATVSSLRRDWGLDGEGGADGRVEEPHRTAHPTPLGGSGDGDGLPNTAEVEADFGVEAEAEVEAAEERRQRALLAESGVAADAEDEDEATPTLDGADEDEAREIVDGKRRGLAIDDGEEAVDALEAIEGVSGFADTRRLTAAADEDVDAAVHDAVADVEAEVEELPDVLQGDDLPRKRARKLTAKALAAQTKKAKLLAKKEKALLKKEQAKAKKEKAKAEKEAKKKAKKKAKADAEAVEDAEDVEIDADQAEEVAPKEAGDAAEAVESERVEPVEEAKPVQPFPTEEPLVKGLRTSAEVAIEKSEEKKRKSAGGGKDGKKDASAADDSRMSIADLVGAPPLVFPNGVTMSQFDGRVMRLERAHVDVPWQIKVGFTGDDMMLTGLPATAGDKGVPADHPYLRYFQPFSSPESGDGNRCLVESVNGIDLSMVTKATRGKIYDAVKKASNLNLVLKFARKH